MMGSGTLLSGTTMRISDEKGQGVRNRFVSSRVSARGLTLMRVFMPLRGRATARNFPKFLDGLRSHIGSCSLEGGLCCCAAIEREGTGVEVCRDAVEGRELDEAGATWVRCAR